jgi:1-acyl-sn-glycerol-3-phosphate acyltransferase
MAPPQGRGLALATPANTHDAGGRFQKNAGADIVRAAVDLLRCAPALNTLPEASLPWIALFPIRRNPGNGLDGRAHGTLDRQWRPCYKDAMLARTLSVVFWLFVVASSLVLFPFALVIWAATVCFDRKLVVLHRFTCFWASLYTWLNPAWRVSVEGRDKIRPHTAYVMVANHQSLLDILVLFRLFVHFKWVSKIENFRIPVIGWNMSLNRYIKLRRGDRKSVDRMMGACERTLASGSSVMMFPEGTRSADGQLRAFKPGAFTLAQRAGVPLLPIVVHGTARALPKRGFVLRGRHDIHIRVLEEIPHPSFADAPVETLSAWVRERIATELEKPRAAVAS